MADIKDIDIEVKGNDAMDQLSEQHSTVDDTQALVCRKHILRKIDLWLLPLVRFTGIIWIQVDANDLDVSYLRYSIPRQSNCWICGSLYTPRG
jgi:hypothetical protein